MKEESIFLEFVGDSPTTRLIQFLVEGREMDYTMTDMTNAGISWTTLHRIFPKFIKNGIVIRTRKFGRIQLYKLNIKNQFVKQIVELFDSLLSYELNTISEKETVIIKN